MECRDLSVGEHDFHVCPEDAPPLAGRLQSLMQARFVDEISGRGPSSKLMLTSATSQVQPRMSADGFGGLIGIPARRFPNLLSASVSLDMSVSASRYKTRVLRAAIGPFNTGVGSPANFPDFFAPADLGVVELHREVSVIAGRCVQEAPVQRQPLAGVTVELTGLWRQFPASNVFPPLVMENPSAAALRHGLYRDRSAAADQARRRGFSLAVGEEKSLNFPANSGSEHLLLSDRINLNVGDVLCLEPGRAELIEYIEIAAIDSSTSVEQPALVTLAYPTRKLHLDGRVCVRADLQALGGVANNALALDAYENDQTLFLAALDDIDDSSLEIFDGVNPPEYHAVNLYSVLSDSEGFFRLPPVHRIAQMSIRASRADLPNPVDTVFSPDYDRVENRLDPIFG